MAGIGADFEGKPPANPEKDPQDKYSQRQVECYRIQHVVLLFNTVNSFGCIIYLTLTCNNKSALKMSTIF